MHRMTSHKCVRYIWSWSMNLFRYFDYNSEDTHLNNPCASVQFQMSSPYSVKLTLISLITWHLTFNDVSVMHDVKNVTLSVWHVTRSVCVLYLYFVLLLLIVWFASTNFALNLRNDLRHYLTIMEIMTYLLRFLVKKWTRIVDEITFLSCLVFEIFTDL